MLHFFFFNKEAFFSGMFHVGTASLKFHLVERVSVWLMQIFLFCGHEEEGRGIRSNLFSYSSLQIYCVQYSKPNIIKGFGVPTAAVSWPDIYAKNSPWLKEASVERSGRWSWAKNFCLFFLNKRHIMGQHLGPAGVFIKILMSHKFKTVYKQAILLLVCFHVSYKGNARVAGSQWCFAPTEFKHFWGLGTSARAVSLFAAGFGGGRGWCCPLPFTRVLCPLPSAGQSCFASHGSRLVRVKILLIPGAELVLNPLDSGRTGPTSPCAHPSRASPAILGIPMSLPVPVQLQQPWSCRGAAFLTRLERSPRILELHLSSSVLWDMWKASKTDTCWLWSSQVFFPKCLWPLSWVFTFKKIQACVGCKRQGGVGGNHCFYCHWNSRQTWKGDGSWYFKRNSKPLGQARQKTGRCSVFCLIACKNECCISYRERETEPGTHICIIPPCLSLVN